MDAESLPGAWLGGLNAKNEGREIRTPNLLIWSQTRYRCAIPPIGYCKWRLLVPSLVGLGWPGALGCPTPSGRVGLSWTGWAGLG